MVYSADKTTELKQIVVKIRVGFQVSTISMYETVGAARKHFDFMSYNEIIQGNTYNTGVPQSWRRAPLAGLGLQK